MDVGVTAKRLLVDGLDKTSMGLVTSADGDSHIILNSKSLLTSSLVFGGGPVEEELLLIVPCLWWSSCMSDEVT